MVDKRLSFSDNADSGGLPMALLVFRQLLVMMLIVLVSFFVSKKSNFGDKESHYVSVLLLYVVAPAMIIDAFNIPYDSQRMRYFLIMTVLTLMNLGLLILLSLFFGKGKDEVSRKRIPLDKMGVVYSNAGYIGIPIIMAVMGKESVFYLMAFILAFNVVLWIHGQYLMTRTISFKAIITKPTVLGSLFALVLFASPWTLPPIIGNAVSLLGDLNTALSMMLLGILFANFKRPVGSEKFPLWQIARLCVARLVLSPLLMIGLFFLLRPFWGGDQQLRTLMMIIVIVSACPCGISMTSFAVLYDKDYSYASLAVSVSTIISVATVPLFTSLAEKVL